MSNEIQSSSFAPYIDDSTGAVDKLQYAVLLANTGDNPYIAPELHGGDSSGIFRGGPVITDGSNTNTFINAVNTATGKDLSADIKGGTKYTVVYGTNGRATQKSKCFQNEALATTGNYAGPSGTNWIRWCEPQPGAPTTVDPLKLDIRVLIPSSTSVLNVANGVDTTTVFNATGDAFVGLAKLISDNGGTPSNFNGSVIDIKIHSTQESGGGEPITDKLGLAAPAIIPSINKLSSKADSVEAISSTVNRMIGVTQVGSPNYSQTEDFIGAPPGGNPYWTEQLGVKAEILAKNSDWTDRIALRRLNLIPVALRDRLLATVPDDDGGTKYSLDPDVLKTQQITLMESAWTLWQSVSAINTELFGVPALSGVTSSTLSADSLHPELSGSVRENLNFLWDELMGGKNEGGEIGDPDPGSPSISLTKIKELLYGSEFVTTPDNFVPPLTGSVIGNINTMYDTLTAIEERVGGIPAGNLEVDITLNPAIITLQGGLSGLGTEVATISGDLALVSTNVDDLQETVYGEVGDTNRDTFNEAASGKSVVSNINTLWTSMITLLASAGPGTNLTDILAKLDALADAATATQLNEITTKLNALDGLAAQVSTNTAGVSANDTSIDSLSAQQDEQSVNVSSNTAEIRVLRDKVLEALDTTNLTNIVNIIKAVDIDDLVVKLDQVMYDIGNLELIREDVNTNTTDISVLSDISTDHTENLARIVTRLDGLSELDGITPADMQTIINNIANISALDAFITKIDLLNIALAAATHTAGVNTGSIDNINTTISELSSTTVPGMIDDAIAALDLTDLPGYVRTTGSQTVSGEKNFKDTFTVSASSNFTDQVVIGNPDEDKVFDIRTDAGKTYINIKHLPTVKTYDGSLYIAQVNNTAGQSINVLAIT